MANEQQGEAGLPSTAPPEFPTGLPSRSSGRVEEADDFARKAVRNSAMSLFAQDADLRYVWTFNAERSWLGEIDLGECDADAFPAAVAERAVEIKERVLAGDGPASFELPVASGDGVRWFEVRVEQDLGSDGQVVGLVGSSIEITAQKAREDTLKTLLRELSHRSKNLLAIIQSLASQTARYSVTVPEFLVRFRGRIQSLSSSQDIVTDADWRGADLFSLVTMQVERYAPEGMRQISLRGYDVYLSPSAALHVGLALHELAVNAASYGSLSSRGGTVSISSDLVDENDEVVLRLRWQETAGPAVTSNNDTRFGTSTLERIVPNSVGGHASLSYRPEGVHYSLTIPKAHFDLIDQR